MLQVSERYRASKPKLRRLLAELESSDALGRSLYLKPNSLSSPPGQSPTDSSQSWGTTFGCVVRQVGQSDTGLIVFQTGDKTVAVVPPFPVVADKLVDGFDTTPLLELLDSDPVIGVVLLRLGRYAVGVLRGGTLVASKTDTRHVKSRHRAGGSSQRRFERSRERLVRELFDKTCEVVMDVFSPHDKSIDYVLLGGERHTLRGLVQRCRYLKSLEQKTLTRVLEVDRPGQKALEGIVGEVWTSRVLVFAPINAT